MRHIIPLFALFFGLALGTACGDTCSEGAADCDGDALICLDGAWTVQETCESDETCAIEGGVAFCEAGDPVAADAD